jgi:hypothetical protein
VERIRSHRQPASQAIERSAFYLDPAVPVGEGQKRPGTHRPDPADPPTGQSSSSRVIAAAWTRSSTSPARGTGVSLLQDEPAGPSGVRSRTAPVDVVRVTVAFLSSGAFRSRP